MRNSILGVLGEMISRVLSGEELDPKQKSTRDQFLDKLEVLCVLHFDIRFLADRTAAQDDQLLASSCRLSVCRVEENANVSFF